MAGCLHARMILVLVSGMVLGSASARADDLPLRCENIVLHADAHARADVAAICDAAAQTRRWFSTCRFKPAPVIDVVVDNTLEERLGYKAFAIFSARLMTIRILGVEKFASDFAGLPASAAMAWRDWYRSVVVHELTHAVVYVTAGAKMDWISQEYIAAVVQIESLDMAVRASLFRAFPKFSLADNSAMLNEVVYMMAPLAFVISAYFNARGFPDMCAHIRSVVTGNTIPAPEQ